MIPFKISSLTTRNYPRWIERLREDNSEIRLNIPFSHDSRWTQIHITRRKLKARLTQSPPEFNQTSATKICCYCSIHDKPNTWGVWFFAHSTLNPYAAAVLFSYFAYFHFTSMFSNVMSTNHQKSYKKLLSSSFQPFRKVNWSPTTIRIHTIFPCFSLSLPNTFNRIVSVTTNK
jgi:hypothetical protein